jgi:hypothetical protein
MLEIEETRLVRGGVHPPAQFMGYFRLAKPYCHPLFTFLLYVDLAFKIPQTITVINSQTMDANMAEQMLPLTG